MGAAEFGERAPMCAGRRASVLCGDRWGPCRGQGANHAMTTLFRYKESIRRRPVRQPQWRPLKIVLSSLPSDSDAWNMIALQVIIEGMGHQVVNLGAGVPVERV